MPEPGAAGDSAGQIALPSAGQIAPILWGVIETWHEHEHKLGCWEDAERLLTRPHDGWAGLVEHIQVINTFQWHEEDRSRDPGAADTVLAAVKRSIDASNARRVRAVEALDSFLHRELNRTRLLAASGPIPSETPGSIIDRLTVLALKIHHARLALAAAPAPDAGPLETRLDLLTEQMQDLSECLDRLLADVRTGRLRLKLYRQIKIYEHREPRV